MPTLAIDRLTAAVALESLRAHGHDLSTFAQSIDEEWKRFSTNPRAGGRHLVTTGANQSVAAPSGLPYVRTQFIRPDTIDAADRPMAERFLRGVPKMAAEIAPLPDGYRLLPEALHVNDRMVAITDQAAGMTTFHVDDVTLPESLLVVCQGRQLEDVVSGAPALAMEIVEARRTTAAEATAAFYRTSGPGIALTTAIAEWTTVIFEPSYHKPANHRF